MKNLNMDNVNEEKSKYNTCSIALNRHHLKPFEMNGDVAIDFNDLLIHSCQKWQVGAYLLFFYLEVLKVSVIKSKPEIFHRGSSVSYAVKIEGFLLYCQGLFFIVKNKFRSSVWFIAVSK